MSHISYPPPQAATRKLVLEGPSASAAAQATTFRRQQQKDNTPIYNGRLWERTGRPVELFHPAFRIFLDKLKEKDHITALDYRFAEELLRESQFIYQDEEARRSKLVYHMSKLTNQDITQEQVTGRRADGVIKKRDRYNALQAYYAILEFKNEIGTTLCDPTVQGAESYAKYWPQHEMIPVTNLSCCPSFIIAVAGPWICILGAVYLSRIIVQPLTEMLWVEDHPQKESRLVYLTQVFVALREAMSHPDDYYQPLLRLAGSSPREDPARFFPDVRRFRGNDGRETKFSYTAELTRLGSKARTEDGRDVVVKLAQRYNINAHKLLAYEGLAPELLSDQADCQYSGYLMVVMEFIPGKPLKEYSDDLGEMSKSREKLHPIRENVARALEVLHGANLVFGDLRPPNTLVVEKGNGEMGAKLIDFDWCNPVVDGRYPANLSDRITWAAGVERAGLMSKEHDMDMLDKSFSLP